MFNPLLKVTLDGQMVVMGFVVDVTKRMVSVTKNAGFAREGKGRVCHISILKMQSLKYGCVQLIETHFSDGFRKWIFFSGGCY